MTLKEIMTELDLKCISDAGQPKDSKLKLKDRKIKGYDLGVST